MKIVILSTIGLKINLKQSKRKVILNLFYLEYKFPSLGRPVKPLSTLKYANNFVSKEKENNKNDKHIHSKDITHENDILKEENTTLKRLLEKEKVLLLINKLSQKYLEWKMNSQEIQE
jgi:hypothetical protein